MFESCDTGKINTADKIMLEIQKTIKYGNKRYFLHKFPPKRTFRYRIL